MWTLCCERYTRLLMETSPEIPICFLRIYRTDFRMHRRHGAMQHELQDFFNIGDTGDEFRDLT
jgi:hypothetical protein